MVILLLMVDQGSNKQQVLAFHGYAQVMTPFLSCHRSSIELSSPSGMTLARIASTAKALISASWIEEFFQDAALRLHAVPE